MISFTDLAKELGIVQDKDQPYAPGEALKAFAGPIADDARAADTEEISDEDADFIREAWAIATADQTPERSTKTIRGEIAGVDADLARLEQEAKAQGEQLDVASYHSRYDALTLRRQELVNEFLDRANEKAL